jgi:hypothetical protein
MRVTPAVSGSDDISKQPLPIWTPEHPGAMLAGTGTRVSS